MQQDEGHLHVEAAQVDRPAEGLVQASAHRRRDVEAGFGFGFGFAKRGGGSTPAKRSRRTTRSAKALSCRLTPGAPRAAARE